MQSWGITDVGCVRQQNQDAFKIEQLDKNVLLCVVCDGVGGAKSGNIASTLASDVLVQELRATWRNGLDPVEVGERLRQAVKIANLTVCDQANEVADFEGMATTMVAAVLQPERATVLNVGDSRAYHIGSQGIRQVTTDHSLVQMMLSRGELTAEEAENYPRKNVITRAIGAEKTVLCDIFQVEMKKEDCLLLCSDGLSNLVDEQELLFEIVHGEREDCCQRLLQIAQNRGAPDNVTCVLAQL